MSSFLTQALQADDMESVGPRAWSLLLPAVVAFACMLTAGSTRAWAATPAGTVITNTASAVFTDSNATASTTTSNTLSTTVQNAPALTVGAGNQSVTLGMIVVDTFTLTNTGNGTGAFALPADASFAGTATGTALQGYVLNGAATGTCSNATPCTYAILNAQSGVSGIAATGTVLVGVEYSVSTGASLAQTILTTLTASITNVALAGAVAESSATSTATPTDTIVADARLDVQAAATTPGSSGVNITWTVSANNGGGFAARDLQAAKTVLGAGVNGIVLFAKIPTYVNGGSALVVAPTVSTCPSGLTCTVYYNTTVSSAPTTAWTTTQPGTLSTTTWVAVLISGGAGGVELVSATGGSSGAGSVTVPQVVWSFATTQPSGTGAANAPSVTLIANSAIGGQLGMTNVTPIVGRGVTIGTADAASASALTGIESNAVASSGTTPPGGASNIAGSAAFASLAFTFGPNPIANATGAWSAITVPGYTLGTADTNHDFTFVDFDYTATAVNSASNPAGAPSGNSIATGGTPITVLGAISNTGNVDDVYDLTSSPTSGSGGWTVAFFYADCVTALPSGYKRSVLSGQNYSHCVKFTPPANVTAYTVYDYTITATSEWNSATNLTHDVLYAGGAIVTFKTYAVSGCPGGVTPANGGVISGCTITYTVTAVNEAPIITAGSGSGNISPTPTTIIVTENGSASGNAWAANTNGLVAAITFGSCSGCTATGNSIASRNVAVTIPSLAPQATASFTYAVVVK